MLAAVTVANSYTRSFRSLDDSGREVHPHREGAIETKIATPPGSRRLPRPANRGERDVTSHVEGREYLTQGQEADHTGEFRI